MNRKAVSGIMLTLLIGMLAFGFNIQPTKAAGTIYIRADGRIDPPTANITTADNVTYTFTGNNYDSIVVERNNLVIDGVSYTLQGTRTGIGIDLWGRSNVTIKNLQIKAFSEGIWLEYCSNNTIIGNNITNNGAGIWDDGASSCNRILGNNVADNDHGIRFGGSTNNDLRNNTMTGNTLNFGIDGYSVTDFLNNIDTSNTVDGKPIYYWINKWNITIPLDAGYVALINCSEIVVQNLNLTKNGQGILIVCTIGSTIIENNINGNNVGIVLYSSLNNNVSKNNITANNFHAIMLDSSSGNTISRNRIMQNSEVGVHLGYLTSNNTLLENLITANWHGIRLMYASNNSMQRNSIKNNKGAGLWLSYSSNNSISHNNLIDNAGQVNIETPGSVNYWSNEFPSGGNYWSDYNGNDTYSGSYQNETGSDRIGDTPYVINENNQDNYPLMIPWGCPVSYGSNTTITNVTITESTLDFETSGPEGTIGYINVTLPFGFNTTTIKVFVDDVDVTPPPFPTITANTTHYFIYFEFNQSTHYITIQYAIVDMAINNVTLSKTVVGQGYSMNITVTIENQGDFTESFDVSVFYDETVITLPDGKNHTTTTLTSGNSTTLTIPWNTTGVAVGHYVISAKATPLPSETDTTDNIFINGVVTIILRPGGLSCARRGVCPCYH